MTTVVIDRKKRTVYSDTQLTCGGTRNTGSKIFHEEIPNFGEVIIAVCGNYQAAIFLKDYIIDYGFPDINEGKTPKIPRDEFNDADFELAILTKDKKIISYSSTLFKMEVEDDIYTMGSGGLIAKGIILNQIRNGLKINITEAIKIVSEVDLYTNNDIRVAKLK